MRNNKFQGTRSQLVLSGVALAIAAAYAPVMAQDTRYDGVVPPKLIQESEKSQVLVDPNAKNYAGNAQVGGLVVEVDHDALPADGQTANRVHVRVVDAQHKPLQGTAFVTIEVSGGRVLLDGAQTDELGPGKLDADRVVRGTQLKVTNGVAEFSLLAPSTPGDVRLRITAGNESAQGIVSYVPALRDWIAAGLVEGVIALGRKGQDAVQPTRFDDGFEQEIRHFQRTFNGNREGLALHTEVFLKGKISGDKLLTLAYNSDKDTQNRLFGDVKPEEFYPVYGDSALHGNDAVSSSKLYVRVDSAKEYVLYGDFNSSDTIAARLTGSGVDNIRVRDLGDYQRKLLGVKWHGESSRYAADAFASRDTLHQMVEEFRGLGTSGPYAVSSNSAVAGSESLEIVVRDRNQPSLILSVTPLSALLDYTFEPFSGQILLKQPLPAYDANLNPVSLRIRYDVDQGGTSFWLLGANAQVKLTDKVEVGGSAIDDRNPVTPYKMQSANTVVRLGEKSVVIAEVAHTDSTGMMNADGTLNLNDVSGEAWRVDWRSHDDNLDANVKFGKSNIGFNNPSSSLNGGREEGSVNAKYKVSQQWSVFGLALTSADMSTDGRRNVGEVGVAYQANDKLTLQLGLRRIQETAASAQPVAGGFGNTGDGIGGGFFGNGSTAINPLTGQPTLTPSNQFPTTGGDSKPNPIEATTLHVAAKYQVSEKFALNGEFERDVSGEDKQRLALGSDYQFGERSRVYARFEQQTGLASAFSINPADRSKVFVAGVDTTYMQGGQLYNEYRLRDAMSSDLSSSRDLQLATGARNSFDVAEGLRMNTQIERLKSLAGASPDTIALAYGVDYTANPLWKASGRIEYRHAYNPPDATTDQRQDSWLSTLSFARKLDRDWTMLARNYLLINDAYATPGKHIQDRVQIGAAYRDTDTNRLDVLSKYEYKTDRNGEADPTSNPDTRAHIVSVNANYHPNRPLWLDGRLAAKYSIDSFGGYKAYLAGGRVIYDITEKIDLGVLTNTMVSPTGKATQYAHGVEAGYNLAQNLWLSAGYIWRGFHDTDLTGSDYTDHGLFIRIRFKFDENLLAGKNPDINRSLSSAQP